MVILPVLVLLEDGGKQRNPVKDIIFQDSDPPEAAGHSSWYIFSQNELSFQDSDPPEAAGHSSA